ncbi:MAG: hypothetical protein PHV32_09595 [Eubacteriales bacterium]|nr:hypothetical protein [Eubacteriales bacterium]
MNKERLQTLISNYINGFESFNREDKGESNESYKWAVVQRFQDHFDIEADNFADMLYTVWRDSDTMIDSAHQQPFYALVDYARKEPELVRKLFNDLYVPDNNDLTVRQNKIDAFVQQTEILKSKYYPQSWRYTNDQRSTMAYLFLNDPENNYLYKATQAHEFADCVEFYDDWGSGSNFKLPVYYRMCDELVAQIKNSSALLETNKSRYETAKEAFYPDSSLHILAFDIIYASQVYGLYGGITYSHPNTAAKKLYLERVEKAKQCKTQYDTLVSQQEKLAELLKMALDTIPTGTPIVHKTYGQGMVIDNEGQYITVSFANVDQPKKFALLSSIINGFIKQNDSTLYDRLMEFADLIKNESSIASRLKSAEAEMQKYQDYLE